MDLVSYASLQKKMAASSCVFCFSFGEKEGELAADGSFSTSLSDAMMAQAEAVYRKKGYVYARILRQDGVTLNYVPLMITPQQSWIFVVPDSATNIINIIRTPNGWLASGK